MSNKIPCGGFYLDDMLNVNDSGELSIKGGTPYQQLVVEEDGNLGWHYTNAMIYKRTDGSFDISTEYPHLYEAFTVGYPIFFLDESNNTFMLCLGCSVPGDGYNYLFFISPDGKGRKLKVKVETSGDVTITETTSDT